MREWLEAGQARIVKKGPHRIVYKVELPGLRFYIKRNLVTDRWCWIRQLIRPSKARTEYMRARGVAQRGLPTYVPLALGEQDTWLGVGESVLITGSLEDTHELHSFAILQLARMPAPRQARLRHRLATELGKLVARMHDAGIRHNDLHPANVLVRLEPDDGLTLYPIDLNAVRLGPPLSWKQSRENLVILNRWFVLRASRSDRYRFWKSYSRHRQEGPDCTALNSRQGLDLSDDVELHTLFSNLTFWRRRDRRCLKNNRYYRRVEGTAVKGHAVVDLDADLLSALQADPDAPFREAGVRFLKDSPTSTVIELEHTAEGQRRTLIYKRFRLTSGLDPWTSLFRRPAALRSWIHGQGFRERGLPTARPLAILHRRRHGLSAEGYLLTEKIHNAQNLREFVESCLSVSALRKQIGQVAAVLRELHRRCLSHRDLKAANILVSRDYSAFFSPFSDQAWTTATQSLLPIFASTVWLIDLVGVRRHRSLCRSRRVRNLARLNASFAEGSKLTRSDRVRFLRTYLRWGLHGKGDWKSWWRAIERATLEKVRRNHRQGRQLA